MHRIRSRCHRHQDLNHNGLQSHLHHNLFDLHLECDDSYLSYQKYRHNPDLRRIAKRQSQNLPWNNSRNFGFQRTLYTQSPVLAPHSPIVPFEPREFHPYFQSEKSMTIQN